MQGSELSNHIKMLALSRGFDLCGVAPIAPSVFRKEFTEWLERGMNGEMAWMARDPERRLNPGMSLPDAKSVVVVAMNYYTKTPHNSGDLERARFARYARNEDYHDVMTSRLNLLLEDIRLEVESELNGRIYVDTGPILEREIAWLSGIGWYGKNTMIINSRRGSYFLLGEILLDIELPPDIPAVGGCGTCTRCMDACPTGAIIGPYQVDSRRCISYLTIEQKGMIPTEHADKLGNMVFGCDICQEVCPFNVRFAISTKEPSFQPREVTAESKVTDLLYMSDNEFLAAFKNSPVKRTKRRGLLRNAAADLSSRCDEEAIAGLEHALNDLEPLVREQAMQSLKVIKERNAYDGKQQS